MPHLFSMLCMNCFDGKVVCGGAELLAGAVVAVKEREHFVEHGPHCVNLVGHVHSLICQMPEAPKSNEAVALHDKLKRGMQDIKLLLAP